jgi:ssDNA-binding Zn-finger/Zn-ribbon topoisomerase 1
MVQGRRRKESYKSKKLIEVKEEDWVVVEGTHEPIIEREAFWNAQDLLKRDKRVSPKTREFGLFSGFISCADCGRALIKKTSRYDYYYLVCSTYENMSKSVCSRHTMRSDELETAVFTVISKYIDMAVEMSELIAKITESPVRKIAISQSQLGIEFNEKKRAEIERRLLPLYQDWKDGHLSRDQFVSLKAQYDAELEKIKREIEKHKAKEKREKESADGSVPFLKSLIELKGITKLTREIIIGLVKKIVVSEGGGIEVIFKFQDAFERAAEYIEENKNALTEIVPRQDIMEVAV